MHSKASFLSRFLRQSLHLSLAAPSAEQVSAALF